MASPELGTKRHWLVVLPASARLTYRGGERVTDSYEACLDTIIRYQHLSGTTPLKARFLSVQPGDTLWLAIRNVGVIGRGVVDAVHGRPEAEVLFTVDSDSSRILATDPLPTRHMGKVAVGLREAAPTSLHDQPGAVEAFEWWWRELGAYDARRLKLVDEVTSTRDAKNWGRHIADDPVLAASSRTLRGGGLSLGLPAKTSPLDLVGFDKSRLIGITTISGTPKQSVEQALAALGPGMYRLRELQQSIDDPAVGRSFWLAFPSMPDLDLLEFIEETGSGVVWLDGRTMRPGPETATLLAELSRSPVRSAE
ncbi:MAG: hypothetical protein WEC34_01080 [Acidimicrobiia bacterium]|jgi:hypothetical protein